jgi:lysozyme family protein
MTALTYEASRRGYANLWTQATLKPERREAAKTAARRLNINQARYTKAGKTIPWWWVAIIHNLESSASFLGHLHNGDPLTARTRQVPAGRPAVGSPPFTWEESAQDALQMHGLFQIAGWDIARCLFEWERYNGFGYVARKINSPYVWSFTSLYTRGKYVADGKFDSMAVSQQCGAAATLLAMIELKLVTLLAPAPTQVQKETLQFDIPITPVMVSPVKPTPVPITKPLPPTPQWDIVGAVINFLKGLFT